MWAALFSSRIDITARIQIKSHKIAREFLFRGLLPPRSPFHRGGFAPYTDASLTPARGAHRLKPPPTVHKNLPFNNPATMPLGRTVTPAICWHKNIHPQQEPGYLSTAKSPSFSQHAGIQYIFHSARLLLITVLNLYAGNLVTKTPVWPTQRCNS